MPDGSATALDVEDEIDFTYQIACECCCNIELVNDAVARQPDFKAIEFAAPCLPEPPRLNETADLVLIVADELGLPAATARLDDYKQTSQATLLVYLRGDEHLVLEHVPGLVIPRAELADGFTRLIKTLVEPVIPRGLVCVDWLDTKHVLEVDGAALIEEACGSQLEVAIAEAASKIRERASGWPITTMQVSISCSAHNLKARLVHELLRACKEVAWEEATFIVAAPFLDWPASDYFEIRLFARLGSFDPWNRNWSRV